MDARNKSMERMLQQIREFPQYEDIPYAGDFSCPNCNGSGSSYKYSLGEGFSKQKEGILIGWCSTPAGYMMVYECPICFTKYRYHSCTVERNNWELFKGELWLAWILQNDIEL